MGKGLVPVVPNVPVVQSLTPRKRVLYSCPIRSLHERSGAGRKLSKRCRIVGLGRAEQLGDRQHPGLEAFLRRFLVIPYCTFGVSALFSPFDHRTGNPMGGPPATCCAFALHTEFAEGLFKNDILIQLSPRPRRLRG